VPEPTVEEVEEATEPEASVTDLSLDEAIEVAVDPPAADDSPPGVLVALAGVAAVGVAGWAGALAWRRRRPA
jgi:hypothetical protein